MTPTVPPESDPSYDIEFFWDPICPFAWITSRWVAQVAAQRNYRVDWRFISLWMVNEDTVADLYHADYRAGHYVGHQGLRIADEIRLHHGRHLDLSTGEIPILGDPLPFTHGPPWIRDE